VKYLRNKKDGFIYEWHPVLAANPLCEEVTEEEAYPERFITDVVKRAQRRTKKIEITADDSGGEPVYTSDELSQDASRDLPE
jgi:hypothetical protein